jgi:hypothetical protein
MRAQGERLPRERRRREHQVGLDLPSQLVAEEYCPTAAESPGSAFTAGRRRALAAPPVLERREKPGTTRGYPLRAEPAIAIEPERRGGRSEEQTRLAEWPRRRRIEQQRVVPWAPRRQLPQHRGRNTEIANERSARGGAPGQGAQALKRRKISEPLVPPKPNEFERLTSIFICRAVLGT